MNHTNDISHQHVPMDDNERKVLLLLIASLTRQLGGQAVVDDEDIAIQTRYGAVNIERVDGAYHVAYQDRRDASDRGPRFCPHCGGKLQ